MKNALITLKEFAIDFINKYLREDLVLHALAGLMLQDALQSVIPYWVSIFAVIAAGYLKEKGDEYIGGTFSNEDWAATSLGGFYGMVFGAITYHNLFT